MHIDPGPDNDIIKDVKWINRVNIHALAWLGFSVFFLFENVGRATFIDWITIGAHLYSFFFFFFFFFSISLASSWKLDSILSQVPPPYLYYGGCHQERFDVSYIRRSFLL